MLTQSRLRVLGASFLVFSLTTAVSAAMAQSDGTGHDSFRFDNGTINVRQVQQMSVVIETPSGVIYTDPTGGKSSYDGHPAPDIILVSHEHHEHFDADTLEEIAGDGTQIVVPPFVMERLPEELKRKVIALENGTSSKLGSIRVESIPSYGLSGPSAEWHPRGRGNGYVLTVDGQRIYIAGSSDATPEMRQLKDIDIAFLPLYPPYALGVDDAIEAVSAFKPGVTYIYQYNSIRTRDEFVEKIKNDNPSGTRVVARDIGSCRTLAILCAD